MKTSVKSNIVPQTNLAAKTALARLMAAEDIAVEIDGAAPTASFDLENRKLILPIWDVGGDAYDMLVGHEVSHAIYSPQTGKELLAACVSIDPKNPNNAKGFLNIVEDARIERLIKIDYPGLRRSFAAGYREFNARNLFAIKDKDISTLSLIDRVNLHYKLGWLLDIPFSNEELPIVQAVATTRTWDEVVTLSKALYEFAKEQKKNEKKEEKSDKDMENFASVETNDGDGDAESGSGKSDAGDDDESADGSESADDGEESADDKDAGEESADDKDAGEESPDSGEESPSTTNAESKPDSDAPNAPTTHKALEDSLSNLVQTQKNKIIYADIPSLPQGFVIPFATTEKAFEEALELPTHRQAASQVYACWKNRNASDVLALAVEFERRKAADAHRRTTISDTGSLDPTRLFDYRTSDDIFLRASTVNDGKNHGLILLLDMSGSMSGQLLDTVIQLVNLTAFARRVNIPFKVYGFVDFVPSMVEEINAAWGIAESKLSTQWRSLRNRINGGTATRLITLLESGTSQFRWQKAAAALLTWATITSRSSDSDYSKSISADCETAQGVVNGGIMWDIHKKFYNLGFRLNGTPTNEALLGLVHLVPQFKKEKNIQVVNVIVLTDGHACDTPLTSHDISDYYNRSVAVIRDPLTRQEYKTYRLAGRRVDGDPVLENYNAPQQSAVLVKIIKDRSGANVVNINLVTGTRSAGSLIDSAMFKKLNDREQDALQISRHRWHSTSGGDVLRRQFNKNGWTSIGSVNGWDDEILLNTANGADDDFDFESVMVDVSSKKGERELQKAFIKSLENRKGNRPLMARIAEMISKNF